MHQSLALLRWEAPDLPPRHRSLHATLDWSYALLTAHQQALFRRLVVFAGGFTLDGAEAVFTGDVPGADDGAGDGLFYRHPEPPPRPPAALDDLAALVDHSLVQPVDPVAEEPRYRMLETVRQFGLEQLAGERRGRRGAAAAPGLLRGAGRAPVRAPLAAAGEAGLSPAGRRARQRASGAGVGGGERGGGARAAPGAGDDQLLGRPRPSARGPGLAGAGAAVGETSPPGGEPGGAARRRSGRGPWSGSAGWPASRATPTARSRRSARHCASQARWGRG